MLLALLVVLAGLRDPQLAVKLTLTGVDPADWPLMVTSTLTPVDWNADSEVGLAAQFARATCAGEVCTSMESLSVCELTNALADSVSAPDVLKVAGATKTFATPELSVKT